MHFDFSRHRVHSEDLKEQTSRLSVYPKPPRNVAARNRETGLSDWRSRSMVKRRYGIAIGDVMVFPEAAVYSNINYSGIFWQIVFYFSPDSPSEPVPGRKTEHLLRQIEIQRHRRNNDPCPAGKHMGILE
jgi:hypothetical protein